MQKRTRGKKSEQRNRNQAWHWGGLLLLVSMIVIGMLYYQVLSQEGGSGYISTVPQQSIEMPVGSSPIIVQLASVQNSGESGTATLQEIDGKVTVTITMAQDPFPDTSQPAHIHGGSCPDVGAVKYSLTPVVNGKSVTILPITLSDLRNQGDLAINVHKSAQEITVYTACGEIPKQ